MDEFFFSQLVLHVHYIDLCSDHTRHSFVYLCSIRLDRSVIRIERHFTRNFFRLACTNWSPPATIIFMIFLAFEAITFSIFTAIMTGTQLYSIYTDTTVDFQGLIDDLHIFVFFRESNLLKEKNVNDVIIHFCLQWKLFSVLKSVSIGWIHFQSPFIWLHKMMNVWPLMFRNNKWESLITDFLLFFKQTKSPDDPEKKGEHWVCFFFLWTINHEDNIKTMV